MTSVDHPHAQIIYADDDDNDSLPDITEVKEDNQEPLEVTTFRPLYESEKKSQFERHQEDTTLDCQDHLDVHDKLHGPQD